MTEHSLFPAYIKVDYHSLYGPHSQIIPTREWNAVPLVPGNALGSYTSWLGLPVDGQEMVQEYVDKFKPFLLTSSTIDIATVYTLDSDTAPARPRASWSIGAVGTSAAAGWAKATQVLYSMRDTGYNMFKLTHFDIPVSNFNPLSDISGSVPTQDLVGVFTSDAWAWSSRANLKPETFLKVVYDLNDALRKKYGMT